MLSFLLTLPGLYCSSFQLLFVCGPVCLLHVKCSVGLRSGDYSTSILLPALLSSTDIQVLLCFGAFLLPQDVPNCKFSYSTIVAISPMDVCFCFRSFRMACFPCMDSSFDHMLSVHSKISKYKHHTSNQLQVFYLIRT